MKLLLNFPLNLYFPDEAIGATVPHSVLDIAEELGKEDDVDSSNKELEEDKKPKIEDDKENEPDDKDDDEEEVELEEEEKEIGEIDELDDVVNPLSRKALLKEYPDIFKKFPQLEKGYYGNQKYREIFPTLDDAQEAASKLEEYKGIESELREGKSETLFKNLMQENPDSFNTLVDNYLPTLGRVNEAAYFHVIGNVIKTTVLRMARQAEAKKDDDLMTAAKMLHGWAFDDEEVTPPTRFARSSNPEKSQLDKEREEFRASKLAQNQEEVKGRVNETIKATIDKYIDPNEKMPAYMRNAAVRDAVEKVNDLLSQDRTLNKFVEKLWKTAESAKFSPVEVGKIRRAYQERAKALLPHVIKKVRADALKGVERRKADDKDRKGQLPSRGRESSSRNDNRGRQSENNDSNSRHRPAGKSTLDLLSD